MLQVMKERESLKVLDECKAVQIKKSADYQNPLSTVKQADHYPHGIQTIMDMVHQKNLRAKSLIETVQHNPQISPNFESLEDTLKDMINYLSFAVSFIRGKMDGQDIGKDMFNREKISDNLDTLVIKQNINWGEKCDGPKEYKPGAAPLLASEGEGKSMYAETVLTANNTPSVRLDDSSWRGLDGKSMFIRIDGFNIIEIPLGKSAIINGKVWYNEANTGAELSKGSRDPIALAVEKTLVEKNIIGASQPIATSGSLVGRTFTEIVQQSLDEAAIKTGTERPPKNEQMHRLEYDHQTGEMVSTPIMKSVS
jgi:hypothetical protein